MYNFLFPFSPFGGITPLIPPYINTPSVPIAKFVNNIERVEEKKEKK